MLRWGAEQDSRHGSTQTLCPGYVTPPVYVLSTSKAVSLPAAFLCKHWLTRSFNLPIKDRYVGKEMEREMGGERSPRVYLPGKSSPCFKKQTKSRSAYAKKVSRVGRKKILEKILREVYIFYCKAYHSHYTLCLVHFSQQSYEDTLTTFYWWHDSGLTVVESPWLTEEDMVKQWLKPETVCLSPDLCHHRSSTLGLATLSKKPFRWIIPRRKAFLLLCWILSSNQPSSAPSTYTHIVACSVLWGHKGQASSCLHRI